MAAPLESAVQGMGSTRGRVGEKESVVPELSVACMLLMLCSGTVAAVWCIWACCGALDSEKGDWAGVLDRLERDVPLPAI